MDTEWTRIWHEIAARPYGPMAFRFYMQPLMATFFAIRDGLKDAQTGKPAYLCALFTDPEHRKERARETWKSVGKIFILAIVLDLVYELLVLGRLRPIQTVLVATSLAIIPYVLLRGPVTRIAKRARRGGSHRRAA